MAIEKYVLPLKEVIPISEGGTGATTPEQARVNLGAGEVKDVSINGTTITVTFADGTTKTLTTQDDSVPTGFILPYGGSTVPDGWLACNGAAVSRTTYASLFSAIGTTRGSGDGSTTFNLPNMGSNVISEVSTGNLAVKGNGKALGLTNGSINFGMGISAITETYCSLLRGYKTVNYGANVGVDNGTPLSVSDGGNAVGITTDGSKSGMIVPVTATKTTVKYCIKY